MADHANIDVRQMLLPAADASGEYSAAVSYNVLEHIEDHVGALRSMAELVRPGGRVILIVPAFMFAMSQVDIATGHIRRYTKKTMRAAMTEAGLDDREAALRERAGPDRLLRRDQHLQAGPEGGPDGEGLRQRRAAGHQGRRAHRASRRSASRSSWSRTVPG